MPQGTIKSYDEQSRSGLILDDQQNELAYDARSFDGSGVRGFRIGQRVRYEVSGEGDAARVTELTIITM